MPLTLDDTIAAVATPPGLGGIGIIRVSGPQAAGIVKQLFVPIEKDAALEHRKMTPGHVVDPESGKRIDFVLAALFEAPRSYTGEEVVEIHAHGGRLNLEQILLLVLASGARPAEPGEYTLRAFLNGRLDLARAEAVREVIESQTDAALNASRRHLDGDITRFCERARRAIVKVLAHVEALVDFPDEELPEADLREYSGDLEDIARSLTKAAKSYERGRLLHEGAETMIVGRPNVGKSSLLNRLLRSERAIVTEKPGTTRDLIEATVALAGVPVRFVDSAGLREGAEDVEAIGVERAWRRLERSDFVLWVVDGSQALEAADIDLAGKLSGHRGLLVVNKIDLPAGLHDADIESLGVAWPAVRISAKTGAGLDRLEAAIGRLLDQPAAEADTLTLTSARHQAAFAGAAKVADRVRETMAGASPPWELVAADLREALHHLDDVVGVTTPDDILEEIFSRFCIGK